jgi:predicted nucleotidyltransferase
MKSKIMDTQYLKKINSEIVKRLISFDGIKKVIFFGSVAEGKQNEDSDLDILVIKEAASDRYRDMVNFRKSLGGLGIPIDVLVIDDVEFQQKIHNQSNVYYWAKPLGHSNAIIVKTEYTIPPLPHTKELAKVVLYRRDCLFSSFFQASVMLRFIKTVTRVTV